MDEERKRQGLGIDWKVLDEIQVQVLEFDVAWWQCVRTNGEFEGVNKLGFGWIWDLWESVVGKTMSYYGICEERRKFTYNFI